MRPILNLKDPRGLAAMQAIAEEARAPVRRFKGSHSGKHGDGISRSGFHRAMFGDRIVAASEAVKVAFDPTGLLNPGRIVRHYRMHDRALMRFRPGHAVKEPVAAALGWQTGAASAARSRCATTTAPARNWRAAPCAQAAA